MSQCCYICNTRAGISLRNAINIFGDDLLLISGKKLPIVLGEIVNKTIKEDGIHSSIVCKKCQKSIVEYDSLQVRMQAIKMELLDQMNKSVPKPNLSSNTIKYGIQISNAGKQEVKKTEVKKLVLPASKLQPLPPDFMIRCGKWPITRSSLAMPKIQSVMSLPSSSTLNLKVTVGSSVLTQSVNTNSIANKTKTIAHSQIVDPKLVMASKVDEKIAHKLTPTSFVAPKSEDTTVSVSFVSSSLASSVLTSSVLASSAFTSSVLASSPLTFSQPISSAATKMSSSLNFNVCSLPKDFLSSTILTKVVDNLDESAMKKEIALDTNDNNDDQTMEIDEGCPALAVIANNSDSKMIFSTNIKEDDDKSEYLDVRLVGGAEGEYVLGKLQILRDDNDADGDEHTIVMDGENGSIIRVMSGQKLMYGDNEISLIVPDDLDPNDNGDSQDSNSESQIELQVSGDEETANAIIAAAQEQGGAFIKVESGEMYRVESVESKPEGEPTQGKVDSQAALQIVANEDGKFRCLLCEKNGEKKTPHYVGNAEATMQHLRSEHSARLYICCVCGHVERRRADYVAHIEEHNKKNKTLQTADKGKLHECNICKKKYSSRTLLNAHMNMHSGSRPYTCHVCAKTFASKYTHQSHLKTHLFRPRPFKCKQCNKSFFTMQNLNQHEKTHSGVKDFICNVCGKAFGTQHNLEVHGVVHSGSKPFVCGACGKGFARKAEVRDHMRIHTGERPFSCDICGTSFTQRSNLHSHKRATHLDDKRYHCTECPKRFKRRRLLDYHIKAAHTGERSLRCDVCGATFVYPEHFKKHARIHSGEKPYSCEVCGKAFNSRDNRNTHRFMHSDRKPYECVVCGAGYMRKQLLYHHMNTSGHLAESIVVNQPRITKVADNLIATNTVIMETKIDKFPDALYGASELQIASDDKTDEASENATQIYITSEKKIILQEGKSGINLVQGDESTLLTYNVESDLKTDATLLEPMPTDPLADTQNAGALRLVPIELPDGSSGWVAMAATG